MAKGNLFLSQARGKVGSVVFYRNEGEQVTRVYTSQVKNPRSVAQSEQRAIFYTAQRWAAGAKYLIEQGQEGITNKNKARQAFVKQALAAIRSAYQSGDNIVLNAKGQPYMQPVPVALTKGSLLTPVYSFMHDPGVTQDNIYRLRLGTSEGLEDYTLRDFFNDNPSLGLGKQITVVMLVAETDSNGVSNMTPDIAGINYRTRLLYGEAVFTTDEAALDEQFVLDTSSEAGRRLLAPSWGGNADLAIYSPITWDDEGSAPGSSVKLTVGGIAYGQPLAAAIIVSDYTNNKWSRSTSPFIINPEVSADLGAIIDTYGNDASSVIGEEYLDQGSTDTEEGNTYGVAELVFTNRYNTINMARYYNANRTWTPDSEIVILNRITKDGINVDASEAATLLQSINVTVTNSEGVTTGAATKRVNNAGEIVMTVPLTAAVANGTTKIAVTQPDGTTRTVTITWNAAYPAA